MLYLFNSPFLLLPWQARFDACFQLNEYTTTIIQIVVVCLQLFPVEEGRTAGKK